VLGYWTAAKAIMQGWKFWLLVAVWAVTALYFYQEGKESCQEQAYKALEKEMVDQAKKAAKAQDQAVSDALKLERLKKRGQEIKDEADKVVTDDACPLDDDQLRILREVQRQSAD
jgi:hypothetical protein